MSLLHWFLPHPRFSAHAGLIWPVVLGLGPLAQCCMLDAAAHPLWHRQKCVMQMNYSQCYTFHHLKEIVHSSHPWQLKMYNERDETVSAIPFPYPEPAECVVCASHSL